MFHSKTPEDLLVEHLHTLRAHLPGVRDGNSSSVHDSRVATRRVREVLQFVVRPASGSLEELRDRFARAGKALGLVRDADVRIQLIAGLESRIPQAAPWLVTFRHAQERTRQKLVRRLIKRLERLEIGSLIDETLAHRSPLRSVLQSTSRTGQWRRDLSRMIAARAAASGEAIHHATGVYFPNRVHEARIGMKKLRYALEIADELGIPDLESPLRGLKKAQEILGDLHDRQTLLDQLGATAAAAEDSGEDPVVTLVTQVVEAEAERLHQRYLSRRDALLQIARDARAIRLNRPPMLASLVTAGAGALVLSTGALLTQRRRTSTGAASSPRPRAFARR